MQRSISLIDLLSVRESKQVLLDGDGEGFKEMMHNIGFDVRKEVEWQLCLHRPMSYLSTDKAPVYGARWVGEERQDPEWVSSEYCSFENKMEIIFKKDRGFHQQLQEMSTLPNFTQMAIDVALEEDIMVSDEDEDFLKEYNSSDGSNNN